MYKSNIFIQTRKKKKTAKTNLRNKMGKIILLVSAPQLNETITFSFNLLLS